MISVYSVTTAVCLYNLALVLIFFLRRRKDFLYKYGTQALLVITVLAFIRLLVPIDTDMTYIIRSYTVYPAIQKALKFSPLSVAPNLHLRSILLLVWAMGTLVFVAKNLLTLRRQAVQRKRYIVVEHPQIQALVQSLSIPYPVIVTPQVSTPHTVGVLHPTIYLPPLELSKEEWTIVLRHELAHIRSKDLGIKLLHYFLEAVFWWNPVSHLFLRELDAILEFRCDLAVTKSMTVQEKTEYLNTILAVVRQHFSPPLCTRTSSLQLADPCIDLKQRFELVLQYDKTKFRRRQLAINCIAIALFSLSCCIVFQPSSYPDPSEIAGTIPASQMHITYLNEKYYLTIDGELVELLTEDRMRMEPYCHLEIIEINTP